MTEENKTAVILFHGQELFTVKHNNEIYVAVKPIAEGIGINWDPQYRKLISGWGKFNCCHMTMVGRDGKRRAMITIPLKKINGWLLSISPNRVKPELREKIVQYQEECFEALYNYWHKGAAINPRAVKPGTLAPVARELRAAIQIARYLGLEGGPAILSANRAVKNLTGCDCMDVMQVTHIKAESKESHYTPSDIGKIVGGLSGKQVNVKLEKLGYQKSYRDHHGRLKWMVTDKGKLYAILKDTGKKQGSGTPVTQIFWKMSALREAMGPVAQVFWQESASKEAEVLHE